MIKNITGVVGTNLWSMYLSAQYSPKEKEVKALMAHNEVHIKRTQVIQTRIPLKDGACTSFSLAELSFQPEWVLIQFTPFFPMKRFQVMFYGINVKHFEMCYGASKYRVYVCKEGYKQESETCVMIIHLVAFDKACPSSSVLGTFTQCWQI